ncbi:MAG TPA: GntR family transcriptional regulator, partial [Oscillospiraceae bacterium]|nr:GntR family transcriptional regulator [Oscillospiraceae bacterium]
MFISTPLDKSLPSYPRRYYEQIIASINTAILRGDLKEGDKLPSERELADLFETSRVPVREAIKVLEFCGIVEQVAGGGMTVKNIELSSLLQKLYFVIATTDDTLRELFEIRLCLEPYAAQCAAASRTE